METVTLRLLPYAVADGPANMAADEVMLLSAAQAGLASLRFYGWASATVSLGYFQSSQVRLVEPRLASLPWVRRPSGGAMLVHHHELTYCLALPPGTPYQGGESWMKRMHVIIAQALGHLGLGGIDKVAIEAKSPDQVLCFQQQTVGDLTSLGSKIVGSAQRKYRQALMQHGAILLKTSPFAPQLPGLEDLTGRPVGVDDLQPAILEALSAAVPWPIQSGPWSKEEDQLRQSLASEKFASQAWNEKR